MRWICLGVLCPISRDIDGDLIPKIEKQFIYQLPKHRLHTTDDDTNVLVFWDRIGIAEDTNMNQKTREIEEVIQTNNVIVVDLGEDPTFWKKHGSSIMSIVGAGVFSVFIWYLSEIYHHG